MSRHTLILNRSNRAQALLGVERASNGWTLELYSPEEARSKKSHDHYFVLVEEAWANLPEYEADRYPTSEHLRKAALIRAGYRDERSIVCASKAEAERVAAFIKPIDDYAIVIPREAVVTVYTAQSQSKKAMGAKAFQESKEAVLGVLAQMIGVEPVTLAQQHRALPAPQAKQTETV